MNLSVIPLRAKPLTPAERSRRYRLRRKTVTAVTVENPASTVTVSTVQMTALAGRLIGGTVTDEDMQLAAQLVLVFVGSLPADSSIQFTKGEGA